MSRFVFYTIGRAKERGIQTSANRLSRLSWIDNILLKEMRVTPLALCVPVNVKCL